MTWPITRILAGILLFACIAFANNNEITLKNGDRLSGKIVCSDENTVIIETVYAGKVTIDAKHVIKIDATKPASTETVETEANTVAAVAEKAEKPVEKAVAEHATTGSAIKKDAPVKPRPDPVKPKPALFGQGRFFGLANGWEGNANFGFSYTDGNSRTSTMTSGIRASKNGGNDKLTIYARSLWYSNRAIAVSTTQNAVWGGARYDRSMSEKTFGFVSYDFERDRPKNLFLRSVLGTGVGHHMVKNETTELDILGGGAWNRTWQAGPNTDTPEALAGNTLKHKFNGRLRFQQTFTYYQNITDLNEYRFIFDSSISVDITKKIGLQFTIGNRFNNDPVGLAKRNDFLFASGIRWNFGKKK